MNINVIPVSKAIINKPFDCGIEELNRYFIQFAFPNDKKNIGKTFVAISPSDLPLGYYTVSMAQILFSELPENLKTGLPRYPIPAMRIGKLAIDKQYQQKGIGSLLLRDALLRAVRISSEIAIYCVLVDALNEKAKGFYLKFGFIPFPSTPLTLVLPLKTIIQAAI
ncbi:MAG: GNAT family N-acetyltransferase [Spirochaetales bacterium]|nr:GNAT family N-acetyltransferase [Spirochaetales bacterium]